jgi:hypothetical protein
VTTALLLFVGGIVFWGGFNWALEATNKESFCISCHEMEENVPGISEHDALHQPYRCPCHLPGLPRAKGMGAEDDPQDPGFQRSAAQDPGHHRYTGEVQQEAS